MKRELKHAAARKLRSTATEAEKLLWRHLRARQLMECKFRRQQPLGPYIADFVCQEKCLVIELDGGQHRVQAQQDAGRTRFLTTEGYRVLRFWNHEVLQSPEAVVEQIVRALAVGPHPRIESGAGSSPLPQGERGLKA